MSTHCSKGSGAGGKTSRDSGYNSRHGGGKREAVTRRAQKARQKAKPKPKPKANAKPKPKKPATQSKKPYMVYTLLCTILWGTRVPGYALYAYRSPRGYSP